MAQARRSGGKRQSVAIAMVAVLLASGIPFHGGFAAASASTATGQSPVAITAGDFHSCALLRDGTAQCWGHNGGGQLGEGTTTSRSSPVAVSGLTNVTAITAGAYHSCALLGDGTVQCWGGNGNGQLGDGTAGYSPVPVLVERFMVPLPDAPPTVEAHAEVVAEATGPWGAAVNYTAPASHDAEDGDGVATCFPVSGSVFPLGPTEVTCSATDSMANTGRATFNVTVVDTTPPVVDAHPDDMVEATGPSGAVPNYTSPASHDLVDGDGVATCVPGPGALFPLGNTTVNCSATDAHGNTGHNSFNVTVVDTTPPTIEPRANLTAEATDQGGAAVPYDKPRTHDLVDGDGVATCSPTYRFMLGTTTVTCTAVDAHGNQAAPTHFTVTVVDTTPPRVKITGPAPSTVNMTGQRRGFNTPVPMKGIVVGDVEVTTLSWENGWVERVEFAVDGVHRWTDQGPRYADHHSFPWSAGSESAGNHIVSVCAFDEVGLSSCDSVTVKTVPTTTTGVLQTLT